MNTVFIAVGIILSLLSTPIVEAQTMRTDMLVGDRATTISLDQCGASARFVIQKNALSPLHSCKEEIHTVNGKKVVYVEIEYGEGMDCPAGCIYEGHSSIVFNKHEYTIAPKPASLVGINLEIGELFRCWLDGTKTKKVTLINDKGKYLWMVYYNNTKTDEFGNTCAVKGYVKAGKKNDISNISVTFPRIARDCKGNDACIANVATAKLDASLCAKVRDTIYRNGCYLGVAVRTSDRALCDKPLDWSTNRTDEFQKKRCLDAIARKPHSFTSFPSP